MALLPAVVGLVFCAAALSQKPTGREFNGRFGTSAAVPADEATDRIIVKWRSNRHLASRDADVSELTGRSGLRLQRVRAIGNDMQVLRLDREQSGADMERTLQSLRADPNIELAEADRRMHPHAFMPNDPNYITQWYLQAAQPAAIRANEAWDVTKGGASATSSGTVIAVIDTGVRYEHPDLLAASTGGKLLPGYDFVSSDSPGVFATANDGDGWDADASDPGDFLTSADLASIQFRNRGCGTAPSNSSWHGTRTAGMIAASTHNGVGVAGAAFNAWVLPIRALGKCGGFDSDILAAMYWAAGLSIPFADVPAGQSVPPTNPYPAHIINMSLGATGACRSSYVAAVAAISARGALVVASAGNEGAVTDTPANCPGALGVGGLRHVGTKVGYSNLGPEVGVSAPAGNCLNIAPGSLCLFSLDTTSNSGATTPSASDYTTQTNSNVGTSFSSPLAAATGGLMHEINARMPPSLLIARIKSSATPFPTTSDTVPAPPACRSPGVAPIQDTECLCTVGLCGAGMLNAASAVVAAQRPVAVVASPTMVTAGSNVSLDGSGSVASCNRTVVSYAWSVVSGTGSVISPNAAVTAITAPASGVLIVRLTVTDNLGDADTSDITLTSSSASTTSPTLLGGNTCSTPILAAQAAPATPTPSAPSTPANSGGGGALGIELLLLAALSAIRVLGLQRAARLCPARAAR
ncbi:MAG: S8 family serine peptidase [Steroidobacteraceae bacterium]